MSSPMLCTLSPATSRRRVLLRSLAAALPGLFLASAQADVAGLGLDHTPLSLTGDGAVSVGNVYLGNGDMQAYRWDGTTPTSLGSLSGFANSSAQGVSANGGLIAGDAWAFDGNYNYVSRAFQWTSAGGMQALPGLAAGQNSSAGGVSADGHVIVGKATLAGGSTQHAVRWVSGVIEDIAPGAGSFSSYSSAQGVSANGAVVVGYGNSGSAYEAFRWVSGSGMTGLGFLAGHSGSEATGVSDDGAVVVGNSYVYPMVSSATPMRAFRWTPAGGMQDLGVLTAGHTQSRAYGVSGDGAVVVGASTTGLMGGDVAFRWTSATGMESVADWLTANGVSVGSSHFSNAYDVSDDGNTVIGTGEINGTSQGFIARVGGGGGGGGGGGSVIGQQDFQATLAQVGQGMSIGSQFAQTVLFGAHHRTLFDNGLGPGKCMWATGDLGGRMDGDARQALAEVGVCGDFQGWRLGAGLGLADVGQDLTLGGRGDYDGRHLLLEADYLLPGGKLLGSMTGYFGAWDADVRRNYLNGAAVDTSAGSTDLDAWALRARLDWLDVARLGRYSLSPFAAYTHTRSRMDGYTETGGGFPVTFNDYTRTDRELRLGLVGKTAVSQATRLRLSLEWIHPLDSDGTLSGVISGGAGAFALGAASGGDDQARLGVEVDHALGKDSLLNASLHASSGSDAAYVASVGWKRSF